MRSLIVYDGSKSADEVCDLVAAIDWPPWGELRVVTAYAPYLPGSFAPDELFDPATPGIVFEADREAAEARANVAAAEDRPTDHNGHLGGRPRSPPRAFSEDGRGLSACSSAASPARSSSMRRARFLIERAPAQ